MKQHYVQIIMLFHLQNPFTFYLQLDVIFCLQFCYNKIDVRLIWRATHMMPGSIWKSE